MFVQVFLFRIKCHSSTFDYKVRTTSTIELTRFLRSLVGHPFISNCSFRNKRRRIGVEVSARSLKARGVSTGAFADLKYAGMWKQALVPREDLLHVHTPLVHKAGPYISAFHLESSQRLSLEKCAAAVHPSLSLSFSLFLSYLCLFLFLFRLLLLLHIPLFFRFRCAFAACAHCRTLSDVNKFPRVMRAGTLRS